MSIAHNIAQIKSTLPEAVEMVAVSKFNPSASIQEAYDAGQRLFGESRVQELVAKRALLPKDIQWHFIGPLQSNKVKQIAPFISLIHSMDSLKLFGEVDKQAGRCGRVIPVLVEVHIGQEESKQGFTPEECHTLFCEGAFAAFHHVSIVGLMGMASFTDDQQQVAAEFHTLRQLFEKLRASSVSEPSFSVLSMGMSHDYPLAIQEGATMIRVGTRIFGDRS